MNLTSIEWSLFGIHLYNFQGGRQAEFKSPKLVDDKLIHLSKSLPQGDWNKQWNGSWRNVVKVKRLWEAEWDTYSTEGAKSEGIN